MTDRRTTRPLQIGVVLDGPGASSTVRSRGTDWQHPDRWRSTAVAAEAVGVGFVVLADRGAQPAAAGENAVPRPDPIELGAYLAAVTEQIGLVVRTPLTHGEPFHLSNRLSSLDRATRGRLGWWTGVDRSLARARAYGHRSAPDHVVADREAAEILEAVRRLWDSWEDGAPIADVAGGRFLDRDRIHYVDHDGEFFSLRGPALLPRPIQGTVPVLAGADETAGLEPDVVVVSAADEIGLVTAAATVRAVRSAPVLAEIEVGFGGRDGIAWPGAGRLRIDTGPAELERLLRRLAGHIDGVVLVLGDTLADLEVLAEDVLPSLLTDDLVVRPGAGRTLRDRLGLVRPRSRYADVRESVRA